MDNSEKDQNATNINGESEIQKEDPEEKAALEYFVK